MTGPLRNKHTLSQGKRIIEYLHTHRFITSADAWRIGITSLHRRLSDLRESGYVFGNEMVRDEDDPLRHWKRYWLISEPMTKKEA